MLVVAYALAGFFLLPRSRLIRIRSPFRVRQGRISSIFAGRGFLEFSLLLAIR